jgi:alkylresorcinol/alkylpyrone synthase
VEVFGGKVFRTPDLLSVFANTGIKRRHTALPIDWYLQPRGWDARNDAYLEAADALFVQAAERALAAAGIAADAVGTVVTVSSTGIATPSLEARLHGRMGFAPGVRRVPVFGLGCAGGVSGLAVASRLAAADPSRPVLLVVVELCSLSVRADEPTKANVIATALFGDGAAAAVLQGGEGPGRPVVGDAQHLWPDTLDIMGWKIDPTGLGVVLAATLPAFVAKNFGAAVATFRAETGERDARFVCHPGGARVLPALEGVLGLEEGTLKVEREVLADYGNMSAPTVLFVLDRVLKAGEAGPITLAALGPGFTGSFVALDAAA